jgi:hypothetical protein
MLKPLGYYLTATFRRTLEIMEIGPADRYQAAQHFLFTAKYFV